MKIIIVGLGKVGTTLAAELCDEENDVTVIDKKEDLVEDVSGQYDLMGITGNGASHSTQLEAGVETADLLIAVTGSDEINLLCCLMAKDGGKCHSIARVRNPEYHSEIGFIRDKFHISMIINPDMAAALEIARNLKFPSAIDVDSFAKSRVDILKFRVREGSMLNGVRIADLSRKIHGNILICAIERGKDLIIPDGNTVLQEKDQIAIVGGSSDANQFFRQIGILSNQVKNIMIVGGSPLAYYLTVLLQAVGIRVKIIEKSYERCEALSEMLPKATIVHGDGTDKELLLEEGLEQYESFAALTNIDEENILISLYAKKIEGERKIITKINRIAFDEVIRELDLDTIVHPKDITAEMIIRYARSMKNTFGSNVETLHKIIDGKAEALEFIIRSKSRVTESTLQELPIRKGILVACIYRQGKVIIPRGADRMQVDDSVIIVTQEKGLDDIEDILA
ncbi:MAG: Trk system potassium transporter TrkA [Lachnospiraceae bacterium]|nr:Trk system potassium transporter TrkA [Lachnospiraceae bacterium]MCD8395866.1 Trk system potassium transporter TrkA [Lachnospiraceae bacterium]